MNKTVLCAVSLSFLAWQTQAQDESFSIQELPGFCDAQTQIAEQAKELPKKELKQLIELLYLAKIMASADIYLRRNVDIFLHATHGILNLVDDYECAADVLQQEAMQEHMGHIANMLEQRNKAYALWKVADEAIVESESELLSSIADMIRDHGQESLEQFVCKYKDQVTQEVNNLQRNNVLFDLQAEATNAEGALRNAHNDELNSLEFLNVLRMTSDGYYRLAYKSLEVATFLKGNYIVLFQEFSYCFFEAYHNAFLDILEKSGHNESNINSW